MCRWIACPTPVGRVPHITHHSLTSAKWSCCLCFISRITVAFVGDGQGGCSPCETGHAAATAQDILHCMCLSLLHDWRHPKCRSPCPVFSRACRTYTPVKRAPLDNEYILGIVMQQKQHLLLATVTVLLCTASNLAAPVLSGMLFEHLVQQHPMERYAKVTKYICI